MGETALAQPHPHPQPHPNPHPRWQVWRSPPDQPPWARPALLIVAALAATMYAWGIGNTSLEPFYGAAPRSMSESWHNFFFGALDPWGTVTVDKLPGALWVQALSLRIFGFHLWAIVLPQVIEGTLTVLVVFRAVRRLAGAAAGITAALVLAFSPVTVLLNRGNILDSLLILLLVLAADATAKALVTGHPRSLILAGVYVGLAFQAKMLQAWLVLPAVYLAYLVAAPMVSFWRRAGHVALSGLVVVIVSLSWMTAVSAVPAQDRPYVDGSCNNSVFAQVFLYNGVDRLAANTLATHGCSGRSALFTEAAKAGAAEGVGTFGITSGWHRLLTGVFGRDDAWVLIPSLVAAASLLVLRRRRPRTDPVRASVVLWTTWLVITGVFFSTGRYLNSYYLAALMPPMAALCGLGLSTAWQRRHSPTTRAIVLVTVLATTAYAVALIPADAGIRVPVIVTMVAAALLAVGALAASLRPRHASVWTISVGLGVSAVVLILGSAWASTSVVSNGQGPFDSPYEPNAVTAATQLGPARVRTEWPSLVALADRVPSRQSVNTFESTYASGEEILATGHEFLGVGGFSGQVPSPTRRQFMDDVASGRVRYVTAEVDPLSRNPDIDWVVRHCRKLPSADQGPDSLGITFALYLCLPTDTRTGP